MVDTFIQSDRKQVTQSYKHLSLWNPLDETSIKPPIQVVTCFLQKRNKILALQRARRDEQYGLWGIPGGKLDDGEQPITGLIREIEEETKVILSTNLFTLLGTALSHTPTDGQYGLYLYHTTVPENIEIHINHSEHSAYSWVTLEEFQSMDLLTAQGDAFQFVKDSLIKIFIKNLKN